METKKQRRNRYIMKSTFGVPVREPRVRVQRVVRTRPTKRKWLRKSEVNLVRPKFRKTVMAAFNRGEQVPYGVTLLSDAPLTPKEIAWAKEIASKLEASPNSD